MTGGYGPRGRAWVAGLASQGALALSRGGDNGFLFAINAGSDSISVFRWNGDQLQLTDDVASGGVRPVSVTVDQDIVYVLNAGGEGAITGFRVSQKGKLTPIVRSTRSLG